MMRGQNMARKPETDPHRLQVREIFYTIQGEGPFAGHPAVFVRFTGCHLKCWFCDTEWNDADDPYMTPLDIRNTIKELSPWYGPVKDMKRRTDLVVFTGGEPLRQNLELLASDLLDKDGFRIQVETAGNFWQWWCGRGKVTLVISPKTPHVDERFYDSVHHNEKFYWKYIIAQGREQGPTGDGLPMLSTQDPTKIDVELARPRKGDIVYVQPCDEPNKLQTKFNHDAVANIALEYGYRVSLQMHKLLELP